MGFGIKCSLSTGKGLLQGFCIYCKVCLSLLENAKELDHVPCEFMYCMKNDY